MLSIDEQIRILKRRCERILTEEELRAKLQKSADTGKPLRIKLGMDPTAPDVTLGHAVPLKVVRQFQEWGHKAVIIIGDYTARVGDPTGRNELRPQLDALTIECNARTYVEQVGKILLTDPMHFEIRRNSEWLEKMTMMEVIELLSKKTVAQVLAREDFHQRFKNQVNIHLHELLYPLMQGRDSVIVEADVEMGGSDQLFNNLVGRELQQEAGNEGQVVIVTPLLVGTDGHVKMSKSKGNYIAVTDPPSGPDGMFGKIMSLPDSLLHSYYILLTTVDPKDFESFVAERPRDAKVALARHIIAWLHSHEAAVRAENEFNKIFREGGVPDEMPEFLIPPGTWKLTELLVTTGLAASNSEANRKIKEGAVALDGHKISDVQHQQTIDQPLVLRLGRKFARVKP